MKLPLDKAQRKFVSQAAGRGIANMRVHVGMTQEGVAEALGIGVDAVSRLERGVIEPGVGRLVEFAELFQCGVADLLIPASDRPADQAAAIAAELSELSPNDREAVVAIVKQLAGLLRQRQGRPKADRG